MFKTTKKILASLLAILMVVGVGGTTVFAANYDPIPGTDTELTKYLVVDEDAEIPDAEFTFTVSAGAGAEATATTPKVWPGVHPELVKVNGTAQSGTVKFVAGEEATSANAVTALGQANATGKKAAKKTIALDFSGLTFNEPGIYSYEIVETKPASPIRAVDSEVTTIHVYVEDIAGQNGSSDDPTPALEVTKYVPYEGRVTPSLETGPFNTVPVDMAEWDTANPAPAVVADPGAEPVQADYQLPNDVGDDVEAFEAAHGAWVTNKAAYDQYLVDKAAYDEERATEFERREAAQLVAVPNGAEAGEKDDKFVNELASANIKFGKEVTGNSGSKDAYFKLTLELSNLGKDAVLTLDMSEAENGVTHENTATSYSKATMDAVNSRDDNTKWVYDEAEFESERLAHEAAIDDIDDTFVAGKYIFRGVEYATLTEAENAAKAACIAPKAGQQIVADTQGNATVEVYLHDGMYVTLKGLPEGATYALSEEDAAGYTKIEKITQAVNGTRAYEDEVSGTIGEKKELKWTYDDVPYESMAAANAAAVADGKAAPAEGQPAEGVVEKEVKAADQDVYTGWTNNKESVLPTGVITAIGAPLAIGALATGLFLARRKKDEDEE